MGLSHYTGLDVSIIRILWCLSFFLFGTGFLVYLILWVIIPVANTRSEKLQMKGKTPNIENIKNAITHEAKDAMRSVNEFARSERVKSGAKEVVTTVSRLFRGVLVAIAGLVSIFFIIAIIAIAAYLLFGIGTIHLNGDYLTMDEFPRIYASDQMFWLVKVLVNLIIIIPLITLVIRLSDFIFSPGTRVSPRIYQALGITWLLIFLSTAGLAYYTMRDFKQLHHHYDEQILPAHLDTLNIMAESGQSGTLSVFNHRVVTLKIEPSASGEKLLRIRRTSRGRDEETASSRNKRFQARYELKDNQLLLSDRITLEEEEYRGQQIQYILKLPEGTVVKLHPNTDRMISVDTEVKDLFYNEAAGHTFKVEEDGLVCLDCFVSDNHEQSPGDFNMIQANGPIRMLIRQDKNNHVEVVGSDNFREHINYEIRHGELIVNPEKSWSNPSIFNQSDNYLIITVKDLKKLKCSGAMSVELKSLQSTILDVELEGVSRLNIDHIEAENLKLSMEGGTWAEIDGNCDRMSLDLSGTGMIEGYDLKCRNITLDMEGAGKSELYATEGISGEIDGVSHVKYKGSPVVNLSKSGAVKVEKVN